MKNQFKKMRGSLSFNIISAMVILLIVFSAVVSLIGYYSFKNSLEDVYIRNTYNICDVVESFVQGDHIDQYLADGGMDEEYEETQRRMDVICQKMDVSLIYVIKVNQENNYEDFVSVFNCVNEDSNYQRWEIGHFRQTTNEEYRQMYASIYKKEIDHAYIVRDTDLESGIQPHITSMRAIYDSEGNVSGILCAQTMMSGLDASRKLFLGSLSVSIIVSVILVAYMATNYLSNQFIHPIRKVTREAERFAKENTVGDPDALDDISRIGEINLLATAISKMEHDTLNYIENLTQATSEKERIEVELGIAAKIQLGAIPSHFPAFPERKDFDIFASMTPAKEVGGDFYDFFLIDENHLAITIADVSGKGVPAALFMMVTKMLLKEKCSISSESTVEEIIRVVNERVCANNSADMFVTVWFGILDLTNGKIRCVNAGHEDPAICKNGTAFAIDKQKHCLAIGVMEDVTYRSYEIQLEPGDKIFLYTDGVTEATNAQNQLFTQKAMVDSLQKLIDASPEEIVEQMKGDVNAFVGEAPQFDDLTMLCLKYNGQESVKNSLCVAANNCHLDDVNDFLLSFLSRLSCPQKLRMQMVLAVEEIFVNIANYAYSGETGDVEIVLEYENNALSITFIDSGVAYDPLQKEDPDITLSAEDRQIGGLGIYMTKKMMDDIVYERKDGKNILKLRKEL